MAFRSKPGFTFPETLIIGALFSLFVLTGMLLLANERARTRDATRIADMTRIAAAFAVLHAQNASYASAADGCGSVGDQVASCSFSDVLPRLGEIKDPSRYAYLVSSVPDREDFGISFTLERGYGNLAAGKHTLTKDGIR